MKRIQVVAALLLFGGLSRAHAGFEITKDIYRIEQLQAAQDEARAKNKAICILYTDAESTCPLAAQAARDAVEALDGKAVVVYVNARSERDSVPPAAKTALNSPESGKFIPKTVVVDPDLAEVIVLIPYTSGQERKELLSKAKDAVSAWLKTKGKASGGASGAQGGELPTMRIWTSASGKTLEGQFSKLQQDVVFLTIPDGTTMKIPINKLCSADQIAARQLAAPRP